MVVSSAFGVIYRGLLARIRVIQSCIDICLHLIVISDAGVDVAGDFGRGHSGACPPIFERAEGERN